MVTQALRAFRNAPPRIRDATHWLVELYQCMAKGRIFDLAAQTAFWLFLALIPLAAVAGLVAARLSMDNWQRLSPLLVTLPPSTRDLVASELSTVSRWNGGAVGVTSAAVFVWAASSGVHAIFDALEVETGESRSWGNKRLLAVATCLALSVAVAVLAVLGPGMEGALQGLSPYVREIGSFRGAPTLAGRAGRIALSAALLFGYISALYWIGVPPKARRRMPIVPGALVAVSLEATLSVGYSLYVAKMGVGAAYGTGLTIIALTLTALYLFSIAFLVGAAVNRKIAADPSWGRFRHGS